MKDRNIQNLTSIWLLTGKAFNAQQTISGFETVNIPFSEWPNRIWDQQQAMCSDKSHIVKEIIQKINPSMAFTEWKELDENDSADAYGLKLKNEQIGMSLCLKDYIIQQTDGSSVDFIRITDKTNAKQWSDLFLQSFGYLIPDEVIYGIKDQVEFYNLEYEKHLVGTVMIYKLDNSIGIHSLGIITEFRKKGLAEKVMNAVLIKAQKENLDYVHLQSSPMGINLYKKLGFKELFKMYNYIDSINISGQKSR